VMRMLVKNWIARRTGPGTLIRKCRKSHDLSQGVGAGRRGVGGAMGVRLFSLILHTCSLDFAEYIYANQEDLLKATLGNYTSGDEQSVNEEVWDNPTDDWTKDPVESTDKGDLPADDEWGRANAVEWA
jgi:hypothetical protein